MINLAKEVVSSHPEEEIIEYLYKSLSQSRKTLVDGAKEQNLVLMGAAVPDMDMALDILRELKRQNEEKRATRQA